MTATKQNLIEVDGPCGHCDTCGAPCDEHGCTKERSHVIANPTELDRLKAAAREVIEMLCGDNVRSQSIRNTDEYEQLYAMVMH